MPFGYDDAIMLASTLLSGALGGQSSPQEEASQKIFNKLEDAEDYLKSTPFSKEEIMQQLLPTVQKLYRGAADVAAGRIGAATSETGSAGGQAFKEFYTQALAPVIAQGEQAAAGSVSDFGKWFSALDESAKNRYLSAIQLELGAAQELPDMSQMQRTFTGALSGLNIGSNIGANIATANAINQKVDILDQIGQLTKPESAADLLKMLKNFSSTATMTDGMVKPL